MSPYQSAFESAALFELRRHAALELAGKDAREFLHNLCTQDVKNLAVGQACEAFLTTNKARIIAHIWIWHREPDVLLLDFVGPPEKVETHLNRYLISEQVEIRPQPDFALLRIVGPQAKAVLANAGLAPARDRVLPGMDSADLIPQDSQAAREKLLSAGATLGDADTYQVLRVEAGLPEYGIDIDEDRLAMEVNRSEAISYTKGCYLGQETIVMARDRGQVNRKLMGMRVMSGEPLTIGTTLFREGVEIGQATSSVFSPRLQSVIAMAYLRRGNWDAGTELKVESASDGRAAIVCALPFSRST